jgi:two-component system, LytTR family, response regulator
MGVEMTPGSELKVLLVDDEPLARRRLRTLLANDKDVQVIGESGNGLDAIRQITELAPDLVFLDIQMPEMDGFGVVRAVGAEQMPAVVFVTAYDEFALAAFEVHALDYLLKPVDRDRFMGALARAKRGVRSRDLSSRLDSLLRRLATHDRGGGRISFKTDGKLVLLRPDEIDWAGADGSHVRVHVGKGEFVVRESLTHLEERLPRPLFMRVHRSTLVNTARIRVVEPWFQGDYLLLLADGTRLTTGRSYREQVRAFVESTS